MQAPPPEETPRARRWGVLFVGLLLLASLILSALLSFGMEWAHDSLTLHFRVRYETPFPPRGVLGSLERIHGRLRASLGGVAPWMSQERIDIVIHKDRAAYLAGPLHPPPWSTGFASYRPQGGGGLQGRAVETFAQDGIEKTLAHELTHLLMGAYFAEERTTPPRWLDEGLAMAMEDESQRRPPAPSPSLRDLARTAPADDDPAQRVSAWYAQAESLVRFLLETHGPLAFGKLCRRLREGVPLEKAAAQSYPYPRLENLEAAWRRPSSIAGKSGPRTR